MKFKLTAISTAVILTGMIIPNSLAANVDVTLSYEKMDYGYNTYRDYSGPRVDATISPTSSSWSYFFRWNQNRTEGIITQDNKITYQRDYQRIHIGTGYRYRFTGGWVEPRVFIRQDKTININGNNNTNDYYGFQLVWNYSLSDKLVWNGNINPQVSKQEVNRQELAKVNGGNFSRNTQFLYETEQGIRWEFAPNWNTEISFFDSRNRRDDLTDWALGTISNTTQQLRWYITYRTDWGLTIAPYVRKTIGTKSVDRNYFTKTETVKDVTRFALRAQYQFTPQVSGLIEFTRDIVRTLNLPTPEIADKQNYYRAGLRFSF